MPYAHARGAATASFLLPLALVAPAAPHAPAQDTLRDRVQALVARSGADVAVAYRTLDGRGELQIKEDAVFHAGRLATLLNGR